jgi:molybdopterin/thiamine biosynthesis adenylyltransferase
MKRSIALPRELHESLCDHLVRADGQEDLCFAVWFPSRGHSRETGLLHTVILPVHRDREVHGNAEFFPQYFERALASALFLEGGLAFMHSHPAAGWQGMSTADIQAESRMAPTVLAATGLPLVGLTLGARDETWSGRFWDRVGSRKYTCSWAESVRVVGRNLQVSFNEELVPTPPVSSRQKRTVSAWGPKRQATLGRLRVGVVGVGNVGGIVAEALARTGVRNLTLLDFDSVEDVNLDRALHATPLDIGRAKVRVVGDRIARMGVSDLPNINAHELSVCEEEGYRRILDCDVIFSCVDRPWPRSVLNFVAYAHLIPVIDGGIHVSRARGGYRGAEWKAHTVTHDFACLRCLEQYDPAYVSVEQTGHLTDPKYIESLPDEHPLRTNENVFVFGLGLASLETLQFITLTAAPAQLGVPGPQLYHLATGTIDIEEKECDQDCDFPPLVARGELAGHPGTGPHPAAEDARNSRSAGRSREGWLFGWVRNVLKHLAGAK